MAAINRRVAVRTRIWAKGAARTLSATAASVTDLHDESRCGAMLHEILAVDDGYKAIRVDFDDKRACVAALDSDLTNLVGAISEKLRLNPRVELLPGMSLAAGVFPNNSQNVLAIQVDAPAKAGQRWVATALIDPTLLARVFEENNTDKGDIVALMQRGQKIFAETGANRSDTGWLPAIEQPVGLAYHVAAAPSRTGPTFNYATQPALGSDFYILSRFDNSARAVD